MGIQHLKDFIIDSMEGGATHLVTYVEYGSELNIEFKYDSKVTKNNFEIGGSLSGGIELKIASLEVEVEGEFKITDEKLNEQIEITITGHGVKNIPVTNNLKDIKTLLKNMQNNPTQYFDPVVISFDAVPIDQIFNVEKAIFLQNISDRIINRVYKIKVDLNH